VRCNERLLEALERSWFDPKPLPEGWLATALAAGHGSRAREVWRKEGGGHGGIALKDPRLSRTLALWRGILAEDGGEAVAVIACRNPYEVARSLVHRQGLSKQHGLRLWQSYLLEAEAATRGLRRMVVHYDDLLNDPRAAIDRLADLIAAPGAGVEPAAASIDRRRRHAHETAENFFARPRVPDEIKDLFRHLRSPDALSEPDYWDEARAAWQRYWQRESPGKGPSRLAQAHVKTFIYRYRRVAEEGGRSGALEFVRKERAGMPNTAAMKYLLAKALIDSRDKAAAIAALVEARTLDPRLPGSATTLVRLLRAAGRLAEARAVAADAAAREPGNAALHRLNGELLIDSGAFAEAALSFSLAIGIEGDTAEGAMGLARLALAAGWKDAAAGHARRAADLAPGDGDIGRRAAKVLLKCGDPRARAPPPAP
jgi:tetratricopeptide (TPR) repeat protein